MLRATLFVALVATASTFAPQAALSRRPRAATRVQALPSFDTVAKHAAAAALAAALALAPVSAHAIADKRTIGEIAGSGLVFKDTLKVEAFTDPKVPGVRLYLSDFSRPLTDRVAKGAFFSDPGSAGLACTHDVREVVTVAKGASRSSDGEEVFSESRSLLFKSLKVRRLVDEEGGTVVYAAFAAKIDASDDSNSSRFKSAMCAVSVDKFE